MQVCDNTTFVDENLISTEIKGPMFKASAQKKRDNEQVPAKKRPFTLNE